jgi:hypothetical protein
VTSLHLFAHQPSETLGHHLSVFCKSLGFPLCFGDGGAGGKDFCDNLFAPPFPQLGFIPPIRVGKHRFQRLKKIRRGGNETGVGFNAFLRLIL